ncbi:ABC transporter permease [Cellulomonas fimi]|uniref:ABC transporter permease n=1 Tax=Cellulomonas fimi TaxID=1708 RepID=A0A7Y0QHZ4_CELFI|nr:ABC transporter permease [Cellulomonas fimi]NMR20399.1 ABC transporter permease [Cellulomonas fimi]
MTTVPAPTARPLAAGRPAARATRAARVLALVRAEMLLLLRNRTTLLSAVVLTPVGSVFLAGNILVPPDGGAPTGGGVATGSDPALGSAVLIMLLMFALTIVVYANITTTLVSRREELVLKRLLSGQPSRAEIIVACASPAVLVLVVELLLGAVALAVWFDPVRLRDAGSLLLGVVGGVVLFVLLAVASSGLTRTVESAQLTTMPIILVAIMLSGAVVPLEALPDVVGRVAAWTPMHPVVALTQHGLGVTEAAGGWSDLAQPLAALALWLAIAAFGALRWMRWEPRR